jgi:hypothetical protein
MPAKVQATTAKRSGELVPHELIQMAARITVENGQVNFNMTFEQCSACQH